MRLVSFFSSHFFPLYILSLELANAELRTITFTTSVYSDCIVFCMTKNKYILFMPTNSLHSVIIFVSYVFILVYL